jgi:chaperonin cofactor prefoldin
MSFSELQGNSMKAAIVEESRHDIVAASKELESFAADRLREAAKDTGTILKSEYTDALAISMLCAEVRRLRARVERLERGQNIS